MTPHRQLLADFAEHGSQEAFHRLVNLYIGMVHATANRLVNGDTHRAEDIVQTVFADLARHAGSISKEATIGGWLHRRTCHVAATVIRGERRRETREREAMERRALDEDGDAALAQVAPVLDEAINELNEQDRHAIMLRFFDHCDLRTVGKMLGSSEDAAQKRISRALDKLRLLLAHRGVALSGTALAIALGSASANAAPATLAVTVSAGALSTASAGQGFTFTTLKLLIMTKLKMTAIAAVSVALIAGVTTTAVVVKESKPSYTPQGTPNPERIRAEAREDKRAGRYKEALAKHLWYRDNALKYAPNLAGVRNSFALSDWGDLARVYPPAMKELEKLRKEAEEKFRNPKTETKTANTSFLTFAAINNSLQQTEKNVEAFRWLHANNPAVATNVFPVLEEALATANEHRLYAHYIDPDRSYKTTLQLYRLQQNAAQSPNNPLMQTLPAKTFRYRVALLVGVLALNDRLPEAERIAAQATNELNSPEFLAQLDQAKAGVLPQK